MPTVNEIIRISNIRVDKNISPMDIANNKVQKKLQLILKGEEKLDKFSNGCLYSRLSKAGRLVFEQLEENELLLVAILWTHEYEKFLPSYQSQLKAPNRFSNKEELEILFKEEESKEIVTVEKTLDKFKGFQTRKLRIVKEKVLFFDETQDFAIQKMLNSQSIPIVAGPGGAGKTLMLGGLTMPLLARGHTILYVFPHQSEVIQEVTNQVKEECGELAERFEGISYSELVHRYVPELASYTEVGFEYLKRIYDDSISNNQEGQWISQDLQAVHSLLIKKKKNSPEEEYLLVKRIYAELKRIFLATEDQSKKNALFQTHEVNQHLEAFLKKYREHLSKNKLIDLSLYELKRPNIEDKNLILLLDESQKYAKAQQQWLSYFPAFYALDPYQGEEGIDIIRLIKEVYYEIRQRQDIDIYVMNNSYRNPLSHQCLVLETYKLIGSYRGGIGKLYQPSLDIKEARNLAIGQIEWCEIANTADFKEYNTSMDFAVIADAEDQSWLKQKKLANEETLLFLPSQIASMEKKKGVAFNPFKHFPKDFVFPETEDVKELHRLVEINDKYTWLFLQLILQFSRFTEKLTIVYTPSKYNEVNKLINHFKKLQDKFLITKKESSTEEKELSVEQLMQGLRKELLTLKNDLFIEKMPMLDRIEKLMNSYAREKANYQEKKSLEQLETMNCRIKTLITALYKEMDYFQKENLSSQVTIISNSIKKIAPPELIEKTITKLITIPQQQLAEEPKKIKKNNVPANKPKQNRPSSNSNKKEEDLVELVFTLIEGNTSAPIVLKLRNNITAILDCLLTDTHKEGRKVNFPTIFYVLVVLLRAYEPLFSRNTKVINPKQQKINTINLNDLLPFFMVLLGYRNKEGKSFVDLLQEHSQPFINDLLLMIDYGFSVLHEENSNRATHQNQVNKLNPKEFYLLFDLFALLFNNLYKVVNLSNLTSLNEVTVLQELMQHYIKIRGKLGDDKLWRTIQGKNFIEYAIDTNKFDFIETLLSILGNEKKKGLIPSFNINLRNSNNETLFFYFLKCFADSNINKNTAHTLFNKNASDRLEKINLIVTKFLELDVDFTSANSNGETVLELLCRTRGAAQINKAFDQAVRRNLLKLENIDLTVLALEILKRQDCDMKIKNLILSSFFNQIKKTSEDLESTALIIHTLFTKLFFYKEKEEIKAVTIFILNCNKNLINLFEVSVESMAGSLCNYYTPKELKQHAAKKINIIFFIITNPKLNPKERTGFINFFIQHGLNLEYSDDIFSPLEMTLRADLLEVTKVLVFAGVRYDIQKLENIVSSKQKIALKEIFDNYKSITMMYRQLDELLRYQKIEKSAEGFKKIVSVLDQSLEQLFRCENRQEEDILLNRLELFANKLPNDINAQTFKTIALEHRIFYGSHPVNILIQTFYHQYLSPKKVIEQESNEKIKPSLSIYKH